MSAAELEQAQLQLTGEPDRAPEEATLESAPESERWDPVPGSTGRKMPALSNDDEDEEGRSDNERLVEEGVAGAEHEQMVQAARGRGEGGPARGLGLDRRGRGDQQNQQMNPLALGRMALVTALAGSMVTSSLAQTPPSAPTDANRKPALPEAECGEGCAP